VSTKVPLDVDPPPDREHRAPRRVSLPLAILIGLAGSALTLAVTWGANTQRITNLEETVKELKATNAELRQLVSAQTQQVTELKAFTADAIRRLDRIERKIDGQDR
jgi:outer membrane murein-binding lipoprotein Lpp